MMEMQFCKGCNVDHPIEEFYLRKDTGKRRPECKKIMDFKVIERKNKNIEKYKKISENWYLTNKQYVKEKGEIYRKNNKEKIRISKQKQYANKEKIQRQLIREEKLKQIVPIVDKFCKECSKIKSLNEYYVYNTTISHLCMICTKEESTKYRETHIYDKEKNKKYRQNNKEKLKEYGKNKYFKNKHKIALKNKDFYIKNKNKIIKRNGQYTKNRKKIDLNFKLRCYVSAKIGTMVSKQNTSCLKYLEYTPQQLKEHLESLFEPWMSWENHGRYLLSKWKDNDQSTWMWQIDHIIPHSTLPYTSMEDDNFKRCWALSNLRPYSAKQNVLDGTNRTRH